MLKSKFYEQPSTAALIVADRKGVDHTTVCLKTVYNKQETELETSYYRELVFNIEHCIHHQAIIKIALLTMGKNQIDESFGVAKSTLIYRKECVQ